MPQSELHDRRKTKNWVLMGALVAFITIVFAVTIIKMAVAP